MNFLLFLGIFLCGGAGAFCRFTLDSTIKKHWTHSVPVGTLLINLLGSFALGMLTGLTVGALTHTWGSEAARAASLVLGAGFLGGFTTFSTAMVEAVNQARAPRRSVAGALFLVFGQALLCIAVALAGLALTV